MIKHKHTPITDDVPARPFEGPAPCAARPNARAHGGCSYRYVCSCGATQTVNVSGGQEERGAWIAPQGAP